MNQRQRWIDQDVALAGVEWFTIFGGPPINLQYHYCNLHGTESLFDTSPHKFPSGGNMTVLRNTLRSKPATVFAYTQTGGVDYFYYGRVFAHQFANNTSPLPAAIAQSTMLGNGVKGWNRFKPTSRNGSLAQAIVELKDIPHMLEQSNLTHIRKNQVGNAVTLGNVAHHAGSQYLNLQFGWLPLLSDVRDLVRNALKAQERIDQLARDNGRWVRRSGTVDHAESSLSNVQTGSFSLPTFPRAGNETQYYSYESKTRFWFSGKFKYYIPPVGVGPLGKYLTADHVNKILYGTDLSPSLVYELIPWSWLVDWFSSAGASIANYFEDAEDHLVSDYAYVMGNIATSERYTVSGVTANGHPYETFQEYLLEVKQRTAATSFGFYAIPPTLSAKQVSILGALGLSRRAVRG